MIDSMGDFLADFHRFAADGADALESIDDGFVVVGKRKSNSFASGPEEAEPLESRSQEDPGNDRSLLFLHYSSSSVAIPEKVTSCA
jgi:hypothetical protein